MLKTIHQTVVGGQKWLYENDKENLIRYILGTKGKNPLICFGINPSTAEPGNIDNTIKSVERLAHNNSFDSWLMLNIYPQRTTDPKGIHKDLDIGIHENNLIYFNRILKEFPNQRIWAAWGTLIEKRPFLIKCLADIYETTLKYECNWMSIGKKTKKGHPRHPLYLSSKSNIESFDIKEYIKKQLAQYRI